MGPLRPQGRAQGLESGLRALEVGGVDDEVGEALLLKLPSPAANQGVGVGRKLAECALDGGQASAHSLARMGVDGGESRLLVCLLYTSPSPRD